MVNVRVCVAAILAAGILFSGCARRVSLADVAEEGGNVGVVVTTGDGESHSGALVSMTEERLVVKVTYRLGARVSLAGVGESRRVLIDGEPVPGTLAGVDRENGERVARVTLVFALEDVARVTFHRSRTEARTAPIVSHLLGPIVGGLLSLLI